MTTDPKSLIVSASTALTGNIKGVQPGKLEELRARKAAREKAAQEPKLLTLIFDATASRQPTWDRAQRNMAQIVTDLAKLGPVHLDLYCHRGDGADHLGRFESGADAASAMRRISCMAGTTQISRCFDLAARNARADAVILIGDCVDSGHDQSSVVDKAGKIGVKIFAFHEDTNGYDPSALRDGERYYRDIARVSGGAFAKLGDALPLEDLVSAVGAIVMGPDAVKLSTAPKAVQALLKDNPKLLEYKP